MDNKFSVQGKGKERPVPGKEPESSVADDHRAAVRAMMEAEFANIIKEDLKAAAIELADEQRRAIREAVEQNKRAISDALEQEILSIRAKKEELRESIIRFGLG